MVGPAAPFVLELRRTFRASRPGAPRAGRAWALAAVLLSTALAGCMGADEAVEPSAEAEAAAPGPARADGAAPPSGVPAVDPGHMPHMHDYWLGRDRVTLFDGEVEPDAGDAAWLTLVNLFLRKEALAGGTTFTLPDGAIVYEGTGLLELTATWDDPRTTSLTVAWQDGDGPDWSAPQALASGATLTVDVEPAMCDMPHMSKSRWAFRFAPEAPAGAALGALRLKVDIVRMRDVMEFPAHPELFFGEPSKVLLDTDGRSQQVSYAKRVPNLLLDGEFGEHWLTPTELVPMETKAIEVEVLVTKAEASAGEVTEIRLYYLTASSWEPQRAPEVAGSIAERRIVYRFEVEPTEVDSPYGDESQWRVLVEAATEFVEGTRTCGGCVDTDIEFHVRVTAFDHVPE